MTRPTVEDFLKLPIRKKPSFYVVFWLLVAALVAFAFWFGNRDTAPERKRYRSERPFAGQDRLIPILERINANAAKDGIRVSLKDLHQQFFHGQEHKRARKPLSDLGLSAIETDIEESERLVAHWRKRRQGAKTKKLKAFAESNLKWAHIRRHMTAIRREGFEFATSRPKGR